jgi:histidinol-phosphate aminotransferase
LKDAIDSEYLDGVKWMQPKKQIVGLPVYQPGKPIDEVKKEYNLSEVIKLASNENPFGASPRVKDAILKECSNLGVYPDGASIKLREALANHYHIDGNRLIFGNGSDEIIQLITRAYLDEHSNTITATPTFPIYKTNAKIEGAEVIEVPLHNGTHDLAQMKAQINEKTKIVWICNPNNPSGTYVGHDEIVAFLEEVPNHVLVVLDEAYYEYVAAEDYPDSLPFLDRWDNVIILRTFSKIYGLAGLRIGYGIGSPSVIDNINRVRAPFNSNRMAQAAAVVALDDQEYVRSCREKNQQGLEQFYQSFNELNLFYYPSQGNFILVDMDRPGNQMFEEFLREGIIVRSGEALGFPTFVRITVGTEEQNQKIINVISQVLLKGAS